MAENLEPLLARYPAVAPLSFCVSCRVALSFFNNIAVSLEELETVESLFAI